MKPTVERKFTQEESREMYTMLHTIVFALKDIRANGLTVQAVRQLGDNIAVLLSTLERVVYQADKLLNKIDSEEPKFVQEVENQYIKKQQEPVMVCPICKTNMYVEYAVCPNCGADLTSTAK